MNKLTIVKDYIRYYFKSKTKHAIHSPFVFEFVTNVLKQKKTQNKQLAQIETLRKELSLSDKKIEITDFGAGSATKRKTKSVSEIVLHSAKSKKYAHLLYRIIEYYQIRHILELGTSSGLTSMYLATAPSAKKAIHPFARYSRMPYHQEAPQPWPNKLSLNAVTKPPYQALYMTAQLPALLLSLPQSDIYRLVPLRSPHRLHSEAHR